MNWDANKIEELLKQKTAPKHNVQITGRFQLRNLKGEITGTEPGIPVYKTIIALQDEGL